MCIYIHIYIYYIYIYTLFLHTHKNSYRLMRFRQQHAGLPKWRCSVISDGQVLTKSFSLGLFGCQVRGASHLGSVV